MEGSITFMILLQIILIFLNAIFACAEIAVISMNDNKLAKLAEEKNKQAMRLVKLTEQPSRFLATIQVAITLSGFLGSAFAADNFSDSLVSLFLKLNLPFPVKTLDTLAVILITIILSYFTLVFGELIPKQIAMRKSEPLALGISGLISAISKLFAPIVWFLTKSTNAILCLCGIDPNTHDEDVSEEEIRMMVNAGSESGAIDLEEKEFIQNVFEFDDLTAGEIATHRTEISLLWLEESMDDWSRTIHDSRHNLYPICGDSVDDIVGILNAKDYFRLNDKSRENIMKKAVKIAYFVPESIKADVLFRNMKRSHNKLAVVLDEYGGTNGIVTINDLLQRLVGDFEYETFEEYKEPAIEPIDSKTWKIPGNVSLDKVSKALGIPLPSEDYDTFNGFVFSALGNIPEDGTCVELETSGLVIKITKINNHKLQTAIVCLADPNVQSEENDGQEK